MHNHIFSKKYLRRKLVLLTPVITGLLHFYWNSRKIYEPSYSYVKTPKIYPEHTEWSPSPVSNYNRPVLNKCEDVVKKNRLNIKRNTEDFNSYIAYHIDKERKVNPPSGVEAHKNLYAKEYKIFAESAADKILNLKNMVVSIIKDIGNFVNNIKSKLEIIEKAWPWICSISDIFTKPVTVLKTQIINGFTKASSYVSKGYSFLKNGVISAYNALTGFFKSTNNENPIESFDIFLLDSKDNGIESTNQSVQVIDVNMLNVLLEKNIADKKYVIVTVSVLKDLSSNENIDINNNTVQSLSLYNRAKNRTAMFYKLILNYIPWYKSNDINHNNVSKQDKEIIADNPVVPKKRNFIISKLIQMASKTKDMTLRAYNYIITRFYPRKVIEVNDTDNTQHKHIFSDDTQHIVSDDTQIASNSENHDEDDSFESCLDKTNDNYQDVING